MTRPAKPRSPQSLARKYHGKGKSLYEELFAEQLSGEVRKGRVPAFEREVRFAPPRKWRFDFSWTWDAIDDWAVEHRKWDLLPEGIHALAIEIEGAVWTQGRHTRGAGFERDLEKLNEATLRGWVVLRVTTGQVANGEALALVLRAFGQGG